MNSPKPTPLLGHIQHILTARAQPYQRWDGSDGGLSAIAKQPVTSSITVTHLGLAGDEQGDLRVHGGVDKAIHHYAWEHYATWQAELGALPVLQQPGAFGENFSSTGMTESNVCLGDQVAVGSCILELAQSRQPCWKLNPRFGQPDMARRVQSTGRTGWYWRVLQEGQVQAGDAMHLLHRPYPQWPLSRVQALLYQHCLEQADLQAFAQLPLPPSWQKLVQKRLERDEVEDWGRRLEG